VVRAHEPLGNVAELTVDLCDAMEEIRGFVGRAVRGECASEIVDLGKQGWAGWQLSIQSPGFLESPAVRCAPRAFEQVVVA